MNRFSTIDFEIDAEFDLELLDDIWVTFEQGKISITKKKKAGEINTTGKTCKFTLKQTDTGLFNAYMPIAIQIRWVSEEGTADSSDIGYFVLGDVLEEGEI